MAKQPPQHAASQGVGAWRPVFEPTDVQSGCFEVDLVPPQVANFPWPQAMPEGQEHHQSVAVAMPIGLSCLD
jgi:hypothetical protein